MNKKIIFFDIDNTLVDHFENIVQPSTKKALQMLVANGHTIFIATGKPPSYMKELEERLEFKIDNYICMNGSYIVYQNKLLKQTFLDKDKISSFINYCNDNNYCYSLVNESGIVTPFDKQDIMVNYFNYFNAPYPQIKVYDEDVNYSQMSIMATSNDDQLINDLSYFQLIRMNDYGFNVIGKNSGKEAGISTILEILKISLSDTCCFGDGLNDIGMFKLCHMSIALGNASDELKSYATYVTDHISHDGLYNACLKLGLIA